MRESTEKSNIVKLLMNYCPMEHVPEQLQWGHEKEIAASELYLKNISKKHNKVSLVQSGLIRELMNRRLSHHGAVGSPYSTTPLSCRNLNLRFAVKTTTFLPDRQIFSPFLKFVFIF